MSIAAAASRVRRQASELAELELELARRELKRESGRLGAGAVLALAAGVLAVLGLGFALAAAAAGLSVVLPTWAAILCVAGAVSIVALIAGAVGVSLLRRATPVPRQALEEARLTLERVREVSGNGRLR